MKRYLLTILSFLFLTGTISNATVRYVSKTGSSTPPYTSWATAADSIMKCINICVFGDTIYVANGVYKERVDMIPGLTLIGAGMDSCVIDTRGFSTVTYTVRVSDSCYFTGFQTLTKDNTNGIGIVIYDINIENIFASVEKNKITAAKEGMLITSSSLGFDSVYKLIRLNLIKNVERGIRCEQTSPTVEENLILPKWYGIGAAILSLPTFRNNTILLDDPQAVSGYAGGFHIQSVLRNNEFYIFDSGADGMDEIGDSVINNVITGNSEDGILTQDGGVIINNIIKGAQIGIDHFASTPLPLVQYNDVWGNELNYKDITPDSTNISLDPMFVNEDSMDLHLQMFSPLIDVGDPNLLDKDGTRSDIGLYGGPYGESYTYLDLPPRPPVNLTALVDSNIITLTWNRNTEADFNHYNLYSDTVNNFQIDTTKLVTSLPDTVYLYLIPSNAEALYFKLTAIDNQGNESDPSEEVEIIITLINDYPITINDYRLYQNYPNPFNPSTKIGYGLKERGYVKLYVYDIKGELVSVLVNQTKEAGYYEVDFDTRYLMLDTGNKSSNGIASGVYIYQLMIRGENEIPVFSDIKKMILLR